MKKTFCVLTGLLVAASVAISAPEYLILTTSNASTSAVPVRVDYTRTLSGYFEGVCIYRTGTNQVTVEIGTLANQGYGANADRVFLTVNSITTNAVYAPRPLNHTVTGTSYTNDTARFPLCGNQIYLRAYSATITNQTVNAQILVSDE